MRTKSEIQSTVLPSALFQVALLASCFASGIQQASAALIDFETTPLGLPSSNDQVLPFFSAYTFPGLQVSFGFDSNSDGLVDTNPVFEHAGLDAMEPPFAGFSGSSGTDTADPGFGSQLGQYFLRSPVGGSDFGKLIINYLSSFPVTAASGEIWDIDGTGQLGGPIMDTEEYTVTAYDALNNVLATQVSPLGTLTTPIAPLDGRPWLFSFSGLSAGISRIEIDFTGSKAMGIGLAFNNFNPTGIVPEPSAWLLAALAAGLMPCGWRKRRPPNGR
jgi:hypothetical protein